MTGGKPEVAVKMLKPNSLEQDKIKFLQEAAIMGQFSHQNIVRLYGVVTLGEPVSETNKTSLIQDHVCNQLQGHTFFLCRP